GPRRLCGILERRPHPPPQPLPPVDHRSDGLERQRQPRDAQRARRHGRRGRGPDLPGPLHHPRLRSLVPADARLPDPVQGRPRPGRPMARPRPPRTRPQFRWLRRLPPEPLILPASGSSGGGGPHEMWWRGRCRGLRGSRANLLGRASYPSTTLRVVPLPIRRWGGQPPPLLAWRGCYRLSGMTAHPFDTILIVVFGSQVTQLIARRVREAGVDGGIAPFNAADAVLERLK